MRRVSAVALCALLLVASACSGDDEPEPVVAPEQTEPSPEPDPVCPITGEAIPNNVDVTRPAVALKIENSSAARPQSGLEDADLVYEELVEGGITRFMAIYHCQQVTKAGPVRSARFDDPKLAQPFTGMLAYSGSNSIVEREIEKKGVISIDEDSAAGALYRDPPGVLEIHNLFANTLKLQRHPLVKKSYPPSPDAFVFGDTPDGAERAKRITVNFHPANTIEYRWKGGAWKRWEAGLPFASATGDQIAPANVLLQEVRVDNSRSIVDVTGNPSPDIRLTGKGRAFLFRDGTVQVGTWRIGDAGDPPVFKADDGELFVFAPGSIWVELVPSKKGDVKGALDYK